MVCPSATSEAGARGPRFGLVVATTTSRRDNKDQMIRPLDSYRAFPREHLKNFKPLTTVYVPVVNTFKKIDQAVSLITLESIPRSNRKRPHIGKYF
jgi:hypothetical protein